jgi:hypothetical protein
MKPNKYSYIFLALCMLAVFSGSAISQEKPQSPSSAKLTLVQAVMCEEVQANRPKNPTVVFSAARERAVCFTAFDPVPQKTYIYHRWYHREIPSANIRLTLKPPRWSTFSSIQRRVTDKGPWRVEIIDANGNILQTLRFSILD